MNPKEYVERYLEASLQALKTISADDVAKMIDVLKEAREKGRRVYVCGNGGSASTASHFANDLGKGASVGREERFRIHALTDNLPWITALGNDLDYSQIFVEQLKNYGDPGDVLVAISGSGNSPNVIEAVSWANERGLMTIGLTGRPGGKLASLARLPVFIESGHMGQIEEGHFLIQHLVGYYFMET